MANKSYIDWTDVAAGSQDIHTFTPLASGEKWVIQTFGAGDVQLSGDGGSSVYVLQWGDSGSWETVRVITLTGNTMDFDISTEFEGDGTKYFRIIRRNQSLSSKALPVWMNAYSRD